MALNLSTLTSPATSGDVLQEVTTTADFLESVPVVRNLSRGSNKGGDAKQSVSLNQPRALPLIKNPAGNLGGYLYIPNVSGNYATGPSVTIGANQTWQAEVDMVITQWGSYIKPMGGGGWTAGFGLIFYSDGAIRVFSKGSFGNNVSLGVTFGTSFNLKYGYDGTELYVEKDGVRQNTGTPSSQSSSITHPLQLSQQNNLTHQGNYAIQKAKLTVNSSVVFDCDFNGSTSIRHGDTKFNCVGGPVSLTTAGQDPVTVVKKDILRFDGVNDNLKGLLGATVTEGYAFLAFSVLGGGGEQFATCFGLNSTGGATISTDGYAITHRNSERLQSFNSNVALDHQGLFDDANGDILHEVKFTSGSQISKINNADQLSFSATTTISSEEFSIAERVTNGLNAAIDLEYLALFSADSVPDEATASKIRNYINSRNQIYLRHQTDGFYFFNPQKADFTGNFTDANTLDGYITGSDLGDTDVRTDLTLVQATQNDQPSTDGYTITFNDSAEHLEFQNSASQNLSGWQICGTSLGTFAYRVQGAVTELNLLGNLGHVNTRQAGQSYGMILLPDSATVADIEAARKLLIDRGAADAVSASVIYTWWYSRADIIEFKNVDMSNVINAQSVWDGCSSMNSFGVTDISNANNFTGAWQSTSSLQQFPAGAKLGTAASNVNFTSAWRSSGLTSFPALDLSNATSLYSTWRDCDDMLSFGLVQTSSVTNFSDTWLGCNSLTSFPLIDTSSGTRFYRTWYDLDSITDFPLLNVSAGRYFSEGWRFCAELVNFPAGLFNSWNPASISSGVFDFAWSGCASLTADSAGNILQSIDASNQHGTDDGTSTGNSLGDSGIDIDYNVATGSLSAATNAAVTSLKAKGWSIIVNNVTL